MVEITNGRWFDVRFRCQILVRDGRSFVEVTDKSKCPKNHVVRTYCFISQVDKDKPKGKDRYKHLASSFVTQNASDEYDKYEGFKRSLKNTMDRINPDTCPSISGLSKEDRRRIWHWYFGEVEVKTTLKNQDLLMIPVG